MTRDDLIALSEVTLFRKLDILDLERFFRDHDCTVRRYESGQIIGQQGDPYNELLLFLRGSAGASMAAPSGKTVRLETLQAPCPVATAVLFSGQKSLPVTLTALETLDCVSLPAETVLDLMREFPVFLMEYLQDNGDKLLFLAEKIRLFQFRSLRQKIVSHILVLADRQRSEEVRMVYSREEMSQLMGVARPSLSREFSSLVKEGLIASKGRQIRILNRPGLVQSLRLE